MLAQPVGRQIEVVCLPNRGHQVVLGTAGSGKTTMAILRAKYLCEAGLPGNGPTLVITFNKTLVDYIRLITGPIPPQMHIENYHIFARGYLASVGRMGYSSIISAKDQRELINSAAASVATLHAAHPLFSYTTEFFFEEIRWLARHGIATLEDYVATTRTGRAEARLQRTFRPLMWSIFETYRAMRAAKGKLYDLDDIATAVAENLETDSRPRMYRHIVIDEGQDLSPEMLRSLAKAIPPDGSLTFFGDVAQQIYGHRMSWRSAGLSPLKSWEFKQNYRNTRQIAALGLAISKMPYYAGAADMVIPIAPTADGAKPSLIEFANEVDELAFIATQAKRMSQTGSVAILVRTGEQIASLKAVLPTSSISLKYAMNTWDGKSGLFYGTYHSAKGIEFDAVLLPFLSEDNMPDPDTVQIVGNEEAMAGDGRLLYVGVTRARTDLIITYSGTRTSLLPPNSDLYLFPKVSL